MTSLRRNIAHWRNAVRGSVLSYPPGHYYSPICEPSELRKHYSNPLVYTPVDMPEIDLNESGQIARLRRWAPGLAKMRFSEVPNKRTRYYYGGDSLYAVGDAMVLASMIQEARPQRIVEIGSGFSSACILDTLDQLGIECTCAFIDPEPQRLLRLLRSTDRVRIIAEKVQNVPITEFQSLDAGDILLIDSSHVLKTCSDVAHELFVILPRLQAGVLVHFHDIFYPFEYPPDWVLARNFSWNESYALRALLADSKRYSIVFWNEFMAKAHPDLVTCFASGMRDGSSLWLLVNEEIR